MREQDMNRRIWNLVALSAALPLTNAGCVVIGVNGCWGGTVWTTEITEQRTLDATGLRSLEARTHNGHIRFAGQAAGATEATVTITKKAGGRTMAEAQAALDALDVFVEPTGADGQRIGWRWRGIKHSGWRADVSFDITAPRAIHLDAETHNGPIGVDDLSGKLRVVTHNGGINVASGGGELHAQTHNGRVDVAYSGDHATLTTHNGGIKADLAGCDQIDATVETHNGSVEVLIGDRFAADVECRTNNGSIRYDAPITNAHATRRRLSGRIGGGGGRLDVTTHNGGVRIRSTAG
jgi:hypothetical protein